jgi:hypothetical protein
MLPYTGMDYALENEVRADFERAHNRASFHNLLAVLTRRPNDLPRLDDARRGLAARGERHRGIQTVPVERIVGTAERPRDFDRAFRPRRVAAAARWLSVARAHYEGRELPPVRLYQIGGDYYVSDGHHRVSVARALGRAFIEAEVIEVLAGAAPGRAGRARRPRLGLGGLRPALPVAGHPVRERGCAA